MLNMPRGVGTGKALRYWSAPSADTSSRRRLYPPAGESQKELERTSHPQAGAVPFLTGHAGHFGRDCRAQLLNMKACMASTASAHLRDLL